MEILAGIVASILTIAVIVMVSSSIKNTIKQKRKINYSSSLRSLVKIENNSAHDMGDNIITADKNGFKPTKG